jgi:hypothetical protein
VNANDVLRRTSAAVGVSGHLEGDGEGKKREREEGRGQEGILMPAVRALCNSERATNSSCLATRSRRSPRHPRHPRLGFPSPRHSLPYYVPAQCRRQFQHGFDNTLRPPPTFPPPPAHNLIVRISRAPREPPEQTHGSWECRENFAPGTLTTVVRRAGVPYRPDEPFLHP